MPLLLACAGCASDRYAGIDLDAGPAPAEVRQFARDARAGSKLAQFELGRRFERGEGVPRDLKRATELYHLAARDSGGPQTLFVPQANGSVAAVPADTGARSPGLPEARQALARLGDAGVGRAELRRIVETCGRADAACSAGRERDLYQLAQLELNFPACSRAARLGGRGNSPLLPPYQSLSVKELDATRACIYTTKPALDALTADQVAAIFEVPALLGADDDQRKSGANRLYRRAFPDSLLIAAARLALGYWRDANEVADAFWVNVCRRYVTRPHLRQDIENRVCPFAGFNFGPSTDRATRVPIETRPETTRD